MTPEAQFYFEVINSLGTVGALLLLVVAFMRGDIIPKSVFDRVLQMYERQLQILTEKFMERLDKVIEEARHR